MERSSPELSGPRVGAWRRAWSLSAKDQQSVRRRWPAIEQIAVIRFAFAESMTDPSYYPDLARTAEEVGFDAMIVPDSILYPEHADSRYPYNADGTREFLDGKPFIEPVLADPGLPL